MIKRAISIIVLLCGFCHPVSATAATLSISIGPAINNALFWIDQSRPTPDGRYDNTWGMAVTTPLGATSLNSLSLYVRSAIGVEYDVASEFGIRISPWSISLNQRIGGPIFESSMYSLTAPNSNEPDPNYWTRPTIFTPHLTVESNSAYFIELFGNGGAAILLSHAKSDAQLYELVGGNFLEFGEYAFRSDIAYSVSAVPLPGAVLLFGPAMLALSAIARRSRMHR